MFALLPHYLQETAYAFAGYRTLSGTHCLPPSVHLADNDRRIRTYPINDILNFIRCRYFSANQTDDRLFPHTGLFQNRLTFLQRTFPAAIYPAHSFLDIIPARKQRHPILKKFNRCPVCHFVAGCHLFFRQRQVLFQFPLHFPARRTLNNLYDCLIRSACHLCRPVKKPGRLEPFQIRITVKNQFSKRCQEGLLSRLCQSQFCKPCSDIAHSNRCMSENIRPYASVFIKQLRSPL